MPYSIRVTFSKDDEWIYHKIMAIVMAKKMAGDTTNPSKETKRLLINYWGKLNATELDIKVFKEMK